MNIDKLINSIEREHNPYRVTQINIFSLANSDVSWLTTLTDKNIDELCTGVKNAKEIDISSWT